MDKDIYSIVPASPEIAQFVHKFVIANQQVNINIVSPTKANRRGLSSNKYYVLLLQQEE